MVVFIKKMFIGLLSTCSTAGLGEPITTISNEIIK